MKITVEEKKIKKEEKSKYPYIGVSTIGNLVLFIKERTGIAILHTDKSYLKKVNEDWIESHFTPFNGTLTISEND